MLEISYESLKSLWLCSVVLGSLPNIINKIKVNKIYTPWVKLN